MTLPIQHLFSEQTENSSIALLKQHFPQCFDKNGAFLPEKMAELMPSSGVDVSREAYSLNWLGKSYARYLRDCQPTTLLSEDQSHNRQPNNQHSQNLLIKGDNLEVLKHLKNAYAKKVKMIYIDPPYNTGSDGFVYQDDRKFSPEQLAKLANMPIDEAKRVLDFTAKKSNSHSAWLTFMYPRLYIARELLKDDGVIFISIDDNEQAQLKLLCDEVFGEENCLGKISRATGTTTGQGATDIGSSLDYLLIYRKTDLFNLNGISLSKEDEKRFSDEDEKGKYSILQLRKTGNADRKEDRPLMYFPIISPTCEEVYPIGPTGYESRWRVGEKKYKQLVAENMIVWKEARNGSMTPYVKYYLEGRTKQVSNLWNDLEGNKKGSLELKELLNAKNVFDNPKPVQLIIRCMEIATDFNDCILDFFAGSGTTAHAVMQLNAEDGGNHRYICVQLPEPTDKKSEAFKAGYHTIFDITKARIEKSALKIQQDFPDYQGDFGFKVFKTVPNFRLAQEDENLSPQMALPDSLNANLDKEQYHTLLTTWRVFDGNALTDPVQAVKLGDYVANLCGNTLYFLHAGFDSLAIKALIETLDNDKAFLPERIVLFGANVESAKQKELKQALDSYTNRKKLNIALLVRY
ncbi:DNA methyltransferase [Pasteurella multocida]|uniref:site-specific DNA-methyltransferase (adenine-specific) n=3 Tax=Pasteurella multocida TaxID=747 RepID=A0A849CJ82_PASMD|nr:site-specific DNA-methyltransferase [Pasteurella multocida]AFF24830.1 type III restriction-modification system EcoP15I [Pasteurella multocida subsp. multocida str. HN06]AFI46756.1 type III restriction-modification system EcoPI enzyme mod [Pasteurella multocida subsp. multocida str. 3480]MCH1906069.1 site-specific DNA-methyltransferase [Pasteurella multocida]MCL7776958.1 site-specific DNA-methyltransferase [Pasteurella multocida]MCL8067704.1 site-specific DNA-methyltransferase [Pasteurella m